MADDVSTVASPPSSLPVDTSISTQQQTDLSHRQNIRLVDGTKDSANALAIDDTGHAKVVADALPLPTGAATETTLASVLAKLSADPATQTTLAAILAKIIASPATEAKQDTGNASLASILAALSDPATETTLAAILAALSSVPVTGPLTDTQLRASRVPVDPSGVTSPVSAASLPLPTGASTETTVAAILAKLSSDPATQTTLAAILSALGGTLAVSGTFWQATQPVSGPLTDTQLRATAVPVSGPLTDTQLRASSVPVTPAQITSGTSTQTSVASSASSVSLLASNANRKMAMIFNDSTKVVYVFFGSSAATTTNFTVKLAAGAYYELPPPVFTGELRGIWASANGAARVTELT